MLTDQQKIQIQTRALTVRDAEIAAVASLLPLLRSETFVAVVDCLLTCSGKVVLSGVGKVGHVGKRVAATLSSTGTPAIFLHPSEAVHGDLGMMSAGDVLLALSNSGKTDEICHMTTLLRELPFSVPILVLTGHADSPLASHADMVLCYGEIQEPCPLGLTPSASLAAMNALCDAMALCLMEIKGISHEQFLQRHHGGYLSQIIQARVTKGIVRE